MTRYLPQDETSKGRMLRYALGSFWILAGILFALWAGLFWLILVPFVLDYYFLRYINWSWASNHPNRVVRFVGTLLGDIVFVLLAVTILQLYFFQNFMIPTSSLEKTLLTGDYVVVNKFSYGVRKPMTPLSLPLAHNTAFGHESYLDWLKLDYERIEGTGKVEHNDLVVFNFPAGDTVALKMTNPDYQTLCHVYSRTVVHERSDYFGEVITRPVDKRDYYVKRCVALPGDTLQIINNQVYINSVKASNPKHLQFNYYVQTIGHSLGAKVLEALDISKSDIRELNNLEARKLGLELFSDSENAHLYNLPLTQEMFDKLKKEPYVKTIKIEEDDMSHSSLYYPLNSGFNWTRENFGPLVIPKKGMTISLNDYNIKCYRRCIEAYELHRLEQKNGVYLIDGKEASNYTFEMDYYFMMGDNRHNSADSRVWGFVPEDHIVGKPVFIFFSKNQETGSIRWSRLFTRITKDL